MSTAKRQPRTAEGTKPFMFKVPPSLLAAAKEKAAQQGESLSSVLVTFLRWYAG